MDESQLAHHLDDATWTTFGQSAGCRNPARSPICEDFLYGIYGIKPSAITTLGCRPVQDRDGPGKGAEAPPLLRT